MLKEAQVWRTRVIYGVTLLGHGYRASTCASVASVWDSQNVIAIARYRSISVRGLKSGVMRPVRGSTYNALLPALYGAFQEIWQVLLQLMDGHFHAHWVSLPGATHRDDPHQFGGVAPVLVFLQKHISLC